MIEGDFVMHSPSLSRFMEDLTWGGGLFLLALYRALCWRGGVRGGGSSSLLALSLSLSLDQMNKERKVINLPSPPLLGVVLRLVVLPTRFAGRDPRGFVTQVSRRLFRVERRVLRPPDIDCQNPEYVRQNGTIPAHLLHTTSTSDSVKGPRCKGDFRNLEQ